MKTSLCLLLFVCATIASPLLDDGDNRSLDDEVKDRLAVIEAELQAIARLIGGPETEELIRNVRQVEEVDDDDEDDEDYEEYEYVAEEYIYDGGDDENEAEDGTEEDEYYEEGLQNAALVAENETDVRKVNGTDSGNGERRVKESKLKKVKAKAKKEKKTQKGLSAGKKEKKTKKVKKTKKAKKGKKGKKSKKGKKGKKQKKGKKEKEEKKKKQKGLSATRALTPDQVQTLCENQKRKTKTDKEGTQLRGPESDNAELVKQVSKLGDAFKTLQEAIAKARGPQPAGQPAPVGESGIVAPPADGTINRSGELSPKENPPSGIDSLVKAALGVQGQAANALKGMLPNNG